MICLHLPGGKQFMVFQGMYVPCQNMKNRMREIENTDDMRKWLIAMCNTNILAPNNTEFGLMIDYPSLKDNSPSKVFGNMKDFTVRAVFHELKSNILAQSDNTIDIGKWMKHYEATSKCYKERETFWKGKDVKDKQYALLDYILDWGKKYRNTKWDEYWKEVKDKTDLEILLLMSLKILPYFSGRGKVEDNPETVIRDFILNDAIISEGAIKNAIVHNDSNSYGRIKSVMILRNAIERVNMFIGDKFVRKMQENTVFMSSIKIDSENEPTLWTDDKHPLTFWFFAYVRTGYFMCKCDYHKKTYTRYEISFGSEFGRCYGRIVHPEFIPTIIANRPDDAVKYMCFMEWDKVKDKKGKVNEIQINYLSNFVESGEWTGTFKNLRLRRMSHDETFYNDLAKELIKNDDGMPWLSSNYHNAFSGYEYAYIKTLHSVTHDNSVYLNDIKLTDEGLVRDEEVQYYIDSKWLDDYPVKTDDEIGIMLLYSDLEPNECKEYVAITFLGKYFPIEDGKVIFPDTEDE